MLMAAKLIGAGLACIALGGASIGIGILFGSLITGVSRNPALRKELFNNAILGFALTEAMGLFALMMALIFLYAF
ncbi:ATPase complex subunit 9 [Rhizoclosmatium sp. JEL0117]|jgi:F-type H+-transporting ATPase subunit c|uniref:ATP synthase subunit 9, mitochondrial n=1 Tax=Chytriomyces confervae TaxID=246404 RepID=A0A4P8NPR2_9FUNG|nr:ATP synthase F0 subunit c [Chytriomyces confervae]KAJ3084747.1 ATPase complex subunit 9 [Rhizoclosmatium hyalinum]KAJ3297500.1 ATPase complex subunit 9 [Rhizoclosmatium sp. JEL0117]QCQ69057.1 ATP synthase F0 subunit c [Chytriomyces confervae]